ncbi:hypothetical protein ACTA71_009841 [Dictyostelium dimigraforme]
MTDIEIKENEDDVTIINIGIEIIVNERSNALFNNLKSNVELFIKQQPNKENEIIQSLYSLNNSLEKTIKYFDYPDKSVDYYKIILLGLSNSNTNNNNNNNQNSNNIFYNSNNGNKGIIPTIPIKFQINYQIFIYKLSTEPPQSELSDDLETSPPYQQLVLPNKSIETLWENLIYEDGLKSKLLSYMSTLILFSKFRIDSNIISNNKVIFLYGPPGTGKTSLAKALAQRISIVYRDRYQFSQLIEINTHSLFSKWFSESGKLVMKMFENIKELLEDQNCFVMILIDEVESLAAARSSAINSGTEPSDSIRVVNAFLTQLDQLKQYSNVLVVATSNITKAVDLAFIDRADIKQFIGPPPIEARKYIFQTIFTELSIKGILTLDCETLDSQLISLSNSTENYSGRAIRKLPTVALSSHIAFTKFPIHSYRFTCILLDFIEKNNLSKNQLLNE